MQLGIVHFHLNRGGVTQVILNHLRALSAVHDTPDRLRVVVLYGGRREAWRDDVVTSLGSLDVRLESVPELAYDSDLNARPGVLATSIQAALQRCSLGAADTVLHVHNHALGKNVSLPGAVSRLARAGYALLLQIHDFAEDFRPANYGDLVTAIAPDDRHQLADRIYAQGSAIHYAVLNGRDRKILAQAGVDPSRLHSLPNPVGDFSERPDRTAARAKLKKMFGVDQRLPYVLYPVRGIRRKNLGELLLWAASNGREAQFALTLPPLNPVEQSRYAAWKRQASELELPIAFEVGTRNELSYIENLAAADRVLTTSVAEGFGMVFLETWLAGLSLIGRDLPEITADFVSSGLDFSPLSAEVKIPLDWVTRDLFVQETRLAYAAVLEAYGRPVPEVDQFQQEVSTLFAGGLLDFARCSARLQAFIVSLVAKDRGRQQELKRLNPDFLITGESCSESTTRRIVSNAQAVRESYSLESSGMRLQHLYHTVLNSPRCEECNLPHGASILDAFLSLPRFNPIRID